MVDLKPCPFCGGEAQTTLRNVSDCGEDFWSVECFDPECGCDFCLYHTEAEAIAAWNTRAERTCENVTDNKDANQFECSKCHCIVKDSEDYYVNVYERGKFSKGNTHGWNYCPNCGRAVKR